MSIERAEQAKREEEDKRRLSEERKEAERRRLSEERKEGERAEIERKRKESEVRLSIDTDANNVFQIVC